ITGTWVDEITTSSFRIKEGPIFANVVLADEVNRAPAKAQAALLEAMEEKQVTLEGESRPLPRPFIVLATQNPVEYEGTYPLPEAELDRFLFKAIVRYPATGEGREFVTPDDVKSLAIPTLRHRVVLRAEAEIEGLDADAVCRRVLTRLDVPR